MYTIDQEKKEYKKKDHSTVRNTERGGSRAETPFPLHLGSHAWRSSRDFLSGREIVPPLSFTRLSPEETV